VETSRPLPLQRTCLTPTLTQAHFHGWQELVSEQLSSQAHIPGWLDLVTCCSHPCGDIRRLLDAVIHKKWMQFYRRLLDAAIHKKWMQFHGWNFNERKSGKNMKIPTMPLLKRKTNLFPILIALRQAMVSLFHYGIAD
jgi:hypothetical protein